MEYQTRHGVCTNTVAALGTAPTFQNEPADIYIAMIGNGRAEAGFVTERVNFGCNLHIVHGGTARVQIGNERREVSKGDVFCLFPDTYTRFENTGRHAWQFSWIILRGKHPVRVLELCGLTPQRPFLMTKAHAALQSVIREAESLYRDGLYDRVYPVATAWRLVSQIVSLGENLAQHLTPSARIASAAKLIMDHHEGTDFSVSDLADQLHISRSTLFRHFRDTFRQSPKTYLENRKIEHACRLLRETPAAIKEISFFCGFKSPQYFNQVFRKRTGVSPGQWRQRQQESPAAAVAAAS